jgi:hypothetical protein
VSLVIHLLWAGVAVLLIERASRLSERWLGLQYPAPALEEHELVVPQDIVALAMRESEEWAQEEVLKAAKERFLKVKDATMPDAQRWNLVRKALGIGELG